MSKDPLHIHGGPITRAKAKKMKAALNALIEDTWRKQSLHEDFTKVLGLEREQSLMNMIQAYQEAV